VRTKRIFEPGDRVVLRKDRAEAYGEFPDLIYTVKATRPHTRYRRIWVYLSELRTPYNIVDSKELRHA
jgi:hypothetical protein